MATVAGLCGLLAPLDKAAAACSPAGPYNNDANTVVCAPGAGETFNTLGGSDSVTVSGGTVVTIDMGTGNDTFTLNGGIVTTVNQDAASPATQGTDTAIISLGTITGTLSQGGSADSYTHTGSGSVATVDQGSGDDTALVGLGATIGSFLQGSGSDSLTLTGGNLTTIDQGSFGDTLTMSGGSAGSITQGTGDDTATISAGTVTGAVVQDDGADTFDMSGGTVGSVAQGSDSDRAFISGGAILGQLGGADTVELAGGTVGDIDLESSNNTLIMWGSASVVAGVNAESGTDVLQLFGGTIGGTISTGSAIDAITIGGTPTTFNSLPIAGVFGATDITGNIVMEGGNDSLTMNDGTLTGSVYMDAGLGNSNALGADGFDDTLTLNGGAITGSIFTDATADAQIGNDSVTIDGATVGGAVSTEAGDDVVSLLAGSAGSIATGAGADQVSLMGGTLAGDADAGADDDRIELNGTIVAGALLGADGNDQIDLAAGAAVSVDGGGGDDLIAWGDPAANIGGPGANTGSVSGGTGSDIVAINSAAIDLSNMTLDGGDDASVTDGQVDALALNGGWSGTLTGARTTGFEVLYIDGGNVSFADDAIRTSTDEGTDAALSMLAGFDVPYGIIVDHGGTLDASNSLAVTGNVTLRAGTLRVGNGGTSQVRISGRLDNAAGSTVDLSSNGAAAGDRLRVGGDYHGGGTIRMDAALDASNASDTIIITGVVRSAPTAIRLTDVGDGSGAGTGIGPGLGIRLIDVSATRGTAAGQFFLTGGTQTVNAIKYDLYLHKNGIWYLQSELRPIVPGAVSVPNMVESIGLTFAGTLHERAGEQEQLTGTGKRRGAWARVIGQHGEETLGTDTLGALTTTTDMAGLQGGLDVYRWTWSDGSATHAGVNFGTADARASSSSNGISGSTTFSGEVAGATLTHFDRGGWYADAGVHATFIDVDATAGTDTAATTSTSWLGSLELGQALALGWGGLSIEPQAQLIYYSRDIETADDGTARWRFALDDALIARLGVRLKTTLTLDGDAHRKATAYVKANLWDVVSGHQDRMSIGTLPVELSGRDTWADAGLGFSVEAAEGLSVFADGDVAVDVNGQHLETLTGKAGLRLNW